MKYLFILITIISFTFCKKDTSEIYMINKTKWMYSIPENYVFRVNNSNKLREKNPFNNPEDLSENQYILLTASKKLEGIKKWSDSNLVMATYTNAKFIKKYGTLKKYLIKTKEYLDKSYSNEKNKPSITISNENIGVENYDIMKQNFENFENKHTYTSVTFHRIIDNELFEIMIIYNNDKDKKKLLETIKNSEFRK